MASMHKSQKLMMALVAAMASIFSGHAVGAKFKILHAFAKDADGYNPFGGLIRDAQGNIYGTAVYGGNKGCAYNQGCGVVFELSPKGDYSVLYRFKGGRHDGSSPEGVTRDKKGNLYGSTVFGGGVGCQSNLGCGTIFKLTASGKATLLHAFAGGADGEYGGGQLVLDGSGNLYGVSNGGYKNCSSLSANGRCGDLFSLSPSGVKTEVYRFTGGVDGALPNGLAPIGAGVAIGVTFGGGHTSSNCPEGCGTVFSVRLPSASFKTLYNFQGGSTDGSGPYDVTADSSGYLHGGASEGPKGKVGMIFTLAPNGAEEVSYSFNYKFGDSTRGYEPMGAIYVDDSGDLYGTTTNGGGSTACVEGCGIVYKILDGAMTKLHTFGMNDGAYPNGLIADSNGDLFGEAQQGGPSDGGVIYEVVGGAKPI